MIGPYDRTSTLAPLAAAQKSTPRARTTARLRRWWRNRTPLRAEEWTSRCPPNACAAVRVRVLTPPDHVDRSRHILHLDRHLIVGHLDGGLGHLDIDRKSVASTKVVRSTRETSMAVSVISLPTTKR